MLAGAGGNYANDELISGDYGAIAPYADPVFRSLFPYVMTTGVTFYGGLYYVNRAGHTRTRLYMLPTSRVDEYGQPILNRTVTVWSSGLGLDITYSVERLVDGGAFRQYMTNHVAPKLTTAEQVMTHMDQIVDLEAQYVQAQALLDFKLSPS